MQLIYDLIYIYMSSISDDLVVSIISSLITVMHDKYKVDKIKTLDAIIDIEIMDILSDSIVEKLDKIFIKNKIKNKNKHNFVNKLLDKNDSIFKKVRDDEKDVPYSFSDYSDNKYKKKSKILFENITISKNSIF
jgi:hypothetical protein